MKDHDYIQNAMRTLSYNWFGHKASKHLFEDVISSVIEETDNLDAFKKTLFYGKENGYTKPCANDINLAGYNSKFADYKESNNEFEDEESDIIALQILHGIIGVATESGELIRNIEEGVPFEQSKANIVEELGDIFWYMAIICNGLGVSFEEVKEKNIEKLRKRYPEKFESEKALNRDLFEEQKVFK